MLPWISATVAPPSVRPSTIWNRDTGATNVSFRKPNWRVPDDLDAAEYCAEQDGHRDDARRQELHIVAAAGTGKRGPEPETQRQREQDWLAERADHAGARAEIPLQLPQPQDEYGVHQRPRHAWRIMRMRSTGAAPASRMLCPVSAMNASSRVRPPVSSRSAAAVPSATMRPWSMTGDPVGDALRLLHVVRREERRHALLTAEAADELPDLVAGLGVEPAGRLIEKQDARLVLQRSGDL